MPTKTYTYQTAWPRWRERITKLSSMKRVSPKQFQSEKKIKEIDGKMSHLFQERQAHLDVVKKLCPHPVDEIVVNEESIEHSWEQYWVTTTEYRCGRCNTVLENERKQEHW